MNEIANDITRLMNGRKELDIISNRLIKSFLERWPVLFDNDINKNIYGVLSNINQELSTMLSSCVNGKTVSVKLNSYFVSDGKKASENSNYNGSHFSSNKLLLSQDSGPRLPYNNPIELFTSLSEIVNINGNNALHFYCNDNYSGLYDNNCKRVDMFNENVIYLSNVYLDDKMVSLKNEYKDGLYIELYDSKQLNKKNLDNFFLYLSELLSYRKQCIEWFNNFSTYSHEIFTYDGNINSMIKVDSHGFVLFNFMKRLSYIVINNSFNNGPRYSNELEIEQILSNNPFNNNESSGMRIPYYSAKYDKKCLLSVVNNMEQIAAKFDLLNKNRDIILDKLYKFRDQLVTQNLSFNAIKKLQGRD